MTEHSSTREACEVGTKGGTMSGYDQRGCDVKIGDGWWVDSLYRKLAATKGQTMSKDTRPKTAWERRAEKAEATIARALSQVESGYAVTPVGPDHEGFESKLENYIHQIWKRDVLAAASSTPREAQPTLSVAGRFDRSYADFERSCLVHLEEEQSRISPDNALIGLLCDSVRLVREVVEVGAATPREAQLREALMHVQRHDLVEYGGYYRDHQMDKADDGEWVRYDDVEAALQASSPAEVPREAQILAAIDEIGAAAFAYRDDELSYSDLEDVIRAALQASSPAEWQPIDTAPTDGSFVWAYAAALEGLPAFQTACAYHQDAGWCVDELRPVTHWVSLRSRWLAPPLSASSPEAETERKAER